jgi:hypothetical protein
MGVFALDRECTAGSRGSLRSGLIQIRTPAPPSPPLPLPWPAAQLAQFALHHQDLRADLAVRIGGLGHSLELPVDLHPPAVRLSTRCCSSASCRFSSSISFRSASCSSTFITMPCSSVSAHARVEIRGFPVRSRRRAPGGPAGCQGDRGPAHAIWPVRSAYHPNAPCFSRYAVRYCPSRTVFQPARSAVLPVTHCVPAGTQCVPAVTHCATQP